MRVIDAMLATQLDDAAPLAGGWHRRGSVPQDTDAPYGVFGTQAPSVPRYTQGGQVARRIESLVYLVKAVFRGESASAAKDAMAAADARLNGGAGLAVAGHALTLLRREGGVEFEETVAGVVYQHVGHLYRIEVQPL